MADDQDDQTQDAIQDASEDQTTPAVAPQEGLPAPEDTRKRQAADTARNTTAQEATGMDPNDPLGNVGRRVGNFVGGLWGASHAPGTDDPLGAGISSIRDYLTGKNAAPAGDVAAAIKRANSDGSLSPDVALHKATADEPDWEKKSALQSGALQIARQARAHARAAADNNHWDQADAFLNEGMKYLPDGNQLKFTRHDNGVVASVSKLGTDQTDVVNLTPQQYSAWLHSHASDPDALMRGDVVDSLRQVAAPRTEAGPSMSLQGTSDEPGQPSAPTMEQIGSQVRTAARENAPELAQRAEERQLAQRIAPDQQQHANEIAGQVLDTQLGRYNDMEAARQQLSQGRNVDMGRFGNAGRREDYVGQAERAIGDIRRDKDGNLWTRSPGGNVIPYNAQAADRQAQDQTINPGVIPRSVASELGAQERAQYARRLDERARTSQQAAQEKVRGGGSYDAFDANMARYGNQLGSPEDIERSAEMADAARAEGNGYRLRGGNYDSEGQQGEPPTPPQRRFRRGGHRRRRQ